MKENHIEQLYKDYARKIHSYLFYLCKDNHMADDLTQETFYQAMKSIDKFRGECKVSVWLCQIAKHLWFKEVEKRKKVSFEKFENDINSNTNIEALNINHINSIDLFKILHNFDEKTKELMYLRLTGFLSFKEIGDIIGESEVWARVTFYRTKQKIVKEME